MLNMTRTVALVLLCLFSIFTSSILAQGEKADPAQKGRRTTNDFAGKWALEVVEGAQQDKIYQQKFDIDKDCLMTVIIDKNSIESATKSGEGLQKPNQDSELFRKGSALKLGEDTSKHLIITVKDEMKKDSEQKCIFFLEDDRLILVYDVKNLGQYPESSDLLKGQNNGRVALHFRRLKK